MLDNRTDLLRAGVENLLFNCGSCKPGDRLLLVHEIENDGYYDATLAQAVAQAGLELGLDVTSYGIPFRRCVADPDALLVAGMAQADCTVFFARLGDQVRFRTKDAAMTQVISYALHTDMLSSAFGTLSYDAFEQLKQLINRAIVRARDIRVTCPLGTDFRGALPPDMRVDGDVTRKRFPVSVFTPVPASAFTGKIAQQGFLTGTGSNYYEPYTCELKDTLLVEFEGNHITGFQGAPEVVESARRHYEFVGNSLGIDTYFVHSWHVGIHPGCAYPHAASENFERWSGGAFGNPRLLHFHTCGAYPPGEISLNVLDTTVFLDGVPVWEEGRLQPDLVPGGTELLDRHPDMRALFESPCRDVGQGANGSLSYG